MFETYRVGCVRVAGVEKLPETGCLHAGYGGSHGHFDVEAGVNGTAPCTEWLRRVSAGLLVSSTFCMLACFGLYSELQRTMPVNFLAGQERLAFVLLFQASLVAIVCFFLVGLAGLSGLDIAGLVGIGVTVAALHGLSQQLFLLATVESRSRGNTLRFSHQLLVRALCIIAGAAFVCWVSQSAVLTLLAEAVISVVLAVGIIVRSAVRFPVMWLVRLAIRRLGKIKWNSALTLMAVMVVSFLLMNLDRWLAATAMSAREFAVYAFAWVILAASQSMQALVNASVFPALARLHASFGKRRCFKFTALISLFTLVVGVLLVWPGSKLIGLLIREYFPEYIRATSVVGIFCLAAVLRFSNFFSSYAIVIGKERGLLVVNVMTLLLGVAGWYVLFGSDGFFTLVLLAYFSLALIALNYLLVSAYAIATVVTTC